MWSCNSHFLHRRKLAYRAKILNQGKTKYPICLMYCKTCRNCPKKIGRITGHNWTQPEDTIASILLPRGKENEGQNSKLWCPHLALLTSTLALYWSPRFQSQYPLTSTVQVHILQLSQYKHTKHSPHQAVATCKVSVRLGKATKLLWNISKTWCSSILMTNKSLVF